MRPIEWVNPVGERQVVEQLAEGRGATVVKAGGIDLLDRMRLGISAPARLVNIAALPSLRAILADDKGLRLGAAATLAQLGAEPLLRPRYTAIAQAAATTANPQVRNVATVAGNLLQRPRCWYFRSPDFTCLKKGGQSCPAAEGQNRYHAILGGGPSHIVHPSTMATALVCCGARLRIVSAERAAPREVALDDFFTLPADDYQRENRLGPAELVTEVLVPAAPATSRSVYRAVKERQAYDWPLAEAAAAVSVAGGVVESARLVLGAAAPIPWRAREAEQLIVGKRLTAALAAEAAQAALAGARPLAHNGYKVKLFLPLIERVLLQAAAR